MTIVVTGATGNVGRPLVAELAAAGAKVRAVTRNGATAEFPPLVQPVGSASDALTGASAVFLNSRALGQSLPRVVAEARDAGVTKLVALSAINARRLLATAVAVAGTATKRRAAAIEPADGKACVHGLRDEFRRHVVGTDTRRRRGGRTVRTASTAPIIESDIAAVAALALLTDELDGQRIPLTGPQAFTNSELVEVIGAVLGRPLQYREVPAEVVRQRFVDLGFGAEFADAYHAMLAETLDKPPLVSHDVEKILGRPALTFAQWLSAHRDLFTN